MIIDHDEQSLNITFKIQMKTKQKNVQVVQEKEDEEEDVQDFFKDVDQLEEAGINAADVTKLKNAGFCTISSLLMAMKKELVAIKGLNEAKVEKIQEAARKIQGYGFMSGKQISEMRAKIIKISTGSSKFDTLLGGGLQSMSITEAFGEFRTGKTQLAHTLCVTAQLPISKGGGNGKVIYIDTESTFRPQKIKKIAERFGLDGEQTLENISYAKAYTSEQLAQLLTIAAALMLKDHYCLLIIDSLMACFRVDFMGRGELSERQQLLGRLLSKVRKLSEQFNIVVYITNHVMADPGNTMAHVDPKKPIGGHVLAHASTTRLYMRKGKNDERLIKVMDAPNIAESEEAVILTDAGIDDLKD